MDTGQTKEIGLTASLPVVTDANKILASLSYATFKSNLSLAQADISGLTTGSSPTFTGVLVSGLTASKVVVTDGSKNLASGTNSDAQIAAAVTASHVAVTVSAPISLTGQALSLVNNAGTPATITAIDIGALATTSDTVVPTSKAVYTYAGTAVSQAHARSHALDGTSDHSVGGLTANYHVMMNAGGTALANATNTDSQIAAAVTASHVAITFGANLSSNLMTLTIQALELNTQTANYVFAGPTTGVATYPTFRALVNADLPAALSPSITGLNLSGLTASEPVVTDGSKNLASVSYATFKTSLSLTKEDVAGLLLASSPQFTGLNLSGLTASLPVFTDASKNIASKSVADTLTALGLGLTVLSVGPTNVSDKTLDCGSVTNGDLILLLCYGNVNGTAMTRAGFYLTKSSGTATITILPYAYSVMPPYAVGINYLGFTVYCIQITGSGTLVLNNNISSDGSGLGYFNNTLTAIFLKKQ